MKILRIKEKLVYRPRPAVIAGRNQLRLPLVKCTSCGTTSGNLLHSIEQALPSDHWLYRREPGPVSYAEYDAIQRDVRSTLSLGNDTILVPGTRVGPAHVKYVHPKVQTFEWPDISYDIIRDDAQITLRNDGLIGWKAVNVEIDGPQTISSPPLIKELVITGRGGPAVTQPEKTVIFTCDVCGGIRYKEIKLESFELNESKWDRSDIFLFDRPFGGPYVTERFVEALQQHNFTNYELQDVADWMDEYNNV